jgi:uncharacterized protein YndB with AHSA1/START domain
MMPEILHEIEIDAPPDTVFRAITTEAGFMEWWTLDVETTAVTGSIATFGFYDRSTVFRMRIEELVQDKLVRWTCLGDVEEWADTALLFELSEYEGGGTVLRFSHTGWPSVSGFFRQCNTTWGALMYRLRDFCEGKTPGALFPG